MLCAGVQTRQGRCARAGPLARRDAPSPSRWALLLEDGEPRERVAATHALVRMRASAMNRIFAAPDQWVGAVAAAGGAYLTPWSVDARDALVLRR